MYLSLFFFILDDRDNSDTLVEFVDMILKDQDYNNDGFTPLHCAVVNGHIDTVKLLLRHGADRDLETDVCKVFIEISASTPSFLLRVHSDTLDKCPCNICRDYIDGNRCMDWDILDF